MESNQDNKVNLLRTVVAHRAHISTAMHRVTALLEHRALAHDLSKLRDDEFDGFSRINAAARINKFGSPEYDAGLAQEKPTVDLHFSRNSHHPECGPMGLFDVIEMVCDWWAASRCYSDPRPWMATVKLNLDRKGTMLSPEQRWVVREVAEFLAVLEFEAKEE
jgi:hypothetical protein